MECRLSRADGPWSCQIKIRWEYDGARRRATVEEVPFGPRLSRKEDVELMLRRAQAAVLGQGSPLHGFLKMSADDARAAAKESKAQFSRNVVCVELSGPELTDLSFVDLPGGRIQAGVAHARNIDNQQESCKTPRTRSSSLSKISSGPTSSETRASSSSLSP